MDQRKDLLAEQAALRLAVPIGGKDEEIFLKDSQAGAGLDADLDLVSQMALFPSRTRDGELDRQGDRLGRVKAQIVETAGNPLDSRAHPSLKDVPDEL